MNYYYEKKKADDGIIMKNVDGTTIIRPHPVHLAFYIVLSTINLYIMICNANWYCKQHKVFFSLYRKTYVLRITYHVLIMANSISNLL